MAYNFKNLNEVPVQEKPTENTTVMAFESGQPKQIPASEFGVKVLMIDLSGYTLNIGDPNEISDISYDPIYDTLESGGIVILKYQFNDPRFGLIKYSDPVIMWMLTTNGLRVGAFNIFEVTFTNGSYHTTA